MHILNHPNFDDVVDLENSEYKYYEEEDAYSDMYQKIVLKESVVEDYDFFVFNKSGPSIYVSQRIKDLFRKKKWFGWIFNEVASE